MDHEKIDRRSIALHRAVSEKLRENPSLVQDVVKRIDKQLSLGSVHSATTKFWLKCWKELIESRSVEELCTLLVSPSEEMTRMRQSTPFVNVLSQEERRRVFGERANDSNLKECMRHAGLAPAKSFSSFSLHYPMNGVEISPDQQSIKAFAGASQKG